VAVQDFIDNGEEIKLNKRWIVYDKSDNDACKYCGIMSFSHKHPPNTLPKDFIKPMAESSNTVEKDDGKDTDVPTFSREEFVKWSRHPDYVGNREINPLLSPDEVYDWIEKAKKQAQKDIAQQCYLECLAAECGHGECAESIYSKFPDMITKYEDGDD
jgi:hypothetical protein